MVILGYNFYISENCFENNRYYCHILAFVDTRCAVLCCAALRYIATVRHHRAVVFRRLLFNSLQLEKSLMDRLG